MELRHLRYFVAVAEAENVTRAAAKLRVAQPAVSRQIHDLEEELGLSLFERTAKSLHLTDAGRIFLDEARAVLARADEAIKAVRAVAGGQRGVLHVGYAPSLTVQILPRALRRFQAEYPRVRVALHDLSTEEMLAGVREDRLHVALTVAPSPSQLRALRFHELARYHMSIAVAPSHRFARRRTVSLAQTVAEPLIVYSRADYPEYHAALAKMFIPLRHAPAIAEEHDSVTSLIAAVEAGRGIAVVSSCLECLAGPRLKLVSLTPAGPPVIVGAICRKEGSSALIQRFIDAAGQGS